MSEATPEVTPPAPEATPEPKPTETVEFWKEKAREQEKRAKANAEAAKRLTEIEEAQKSEAQKAADRLAAAEKQAAEATLTAARAEIALEKGLTLTQAKRLVGTTREELAADADVLLKDLELPQRNGNFSPREGNNPQPADDPMRALARGLFATSET